MKPKTLPFKPAPTIRVADFIPGAGKTFAMAQHIKSAIDNGQGPWLYFAPTHDLAGGMNKHLKWHEGCLKTEAGLSFRFPSDVIPKSDLARLRDKEIELPPGLMSGLTGHLLVLLLLGENVSCCHALIERMTSAHFAALLRAGYFAVQDESHDGFLLNPETGPTIADVKRLIAAKQLRAGPLERGLHKLYKTDDFRHLDVLAELSEAIDRGCAFISGSGRECVLVRTFDPEIVRCSREYYCLTFRWAFSTQRIWADYYKIDWEYFDELPVRYSGEALKEIYKELIRFRDRPKGIVDAINAKDVFDPKTGKAITPFCFSWWQHVGPTRLKGVVMAMNSFAGNNSPCAWVVPLDSRDVIAKGSKNINKPGWIPTTARGSNEWSRYGAIIYGLDRYASPEYTKVIGRVCKKISIEKGGDDSLSTKQQMLSEMLQVLFRTGLRNREEIQVLFISQRMQDLLSDWLSGKIPDRIERPARNEDKAAA